MYIRVRVKTKQKHDQIMPISESVYEVHVKEEARHNQANQKIKALLQTYFNTSDVRIVSGHHHPIKLYSVDISK